VHADLSILAGIPEGWKDPEAGIRRNLKAGDLSVLLRQQLGQRLRWNLLQKSIELDGRHLPPSLVELFHVDLSEYGYSIGKETAIDVIRRAALANQYNPVEEYLDLIAADMAIEPIDLDRVATEFLGTQDPLYDAMLASTLVAAVARTFEPGCKFDNCLVLKGGQGVGKSSFVKALASPDLMIDTTQANEKDTLLAIQSCWVMELAELDSLTSKREAGTVKALLSSSIDNFRMPYGRAFEMCPRFSIMIGTCNRDDFLLDDTGSRRFWVIDLHHNFAAGSVIDVSRAVAERDRIWKAAVLAYRAGRQWWLSDEQQNESNRRNRGYEQEHPWESRIARWLTLYTPQGFTTEQCLLKSEIRICEDAIQQKDLQDAANILRRLGYNKTLHQVRAYNNKRVWFPASGASASVAEPEAPQNPAAGGDFADLPHTSHTFSVKSDGGTDGQAQPARWAAAKKGEAPEAEDQISRHTGTVTPQAMEAAPEPLSEKQLNQIEAEASWN